AGTVLGAGLAFCLGRALGQDALRPLLRGRWLKAADRQLSRHGFRSMLATRLFPGVPFAAANYCAAVSRMGLLPFLLATALGSIPNTAAYAVAGARASTPTSPAFLIALACIAVPGLVGAAVAWRKRRQLRGRCGGRGGRRVRAVSPSRSWWVRPSRTWSAGRSGCSVHGPAPPPPAPVRPGQGRDVPAPSVHFGALRFPRR